MDVPAFKLGAPEMLAVAAAGVALGIGVRRHIPALERAHLPASIVGGLLLSLLVLTFRGRVVNIEFDTTLRDLSMDAFFANIGFGANWRLIRSGGRDVMLLFAVTLAGIVLQNGVGVLLARQFGLDPRFGIVAGCMTLTGGSATALAFGPVFEKMGVAGATSVALACPMFGIAAA